MIKLVLDRSIFEYDGRGIAQTTRALYKKLLHQLREQIGKNGRERYEKYFTEKIMVENSLDYYYKILNTQL